MTENTSEKALVPTAYIPLRFYGSSFLFFTCCIFTPQHTKVPRAFLIAAI